MDSLRLVFGELVSLVKTSQVGRAALAVVGISLLPFDAPELFGRQSQATTQSAYQSPASGRQGSRQPSSGLQQANVSPDLPWCTVGQTSGCRPVSGNGVTANAPILPPSPLMSVGQDISTPTSQSVGKGEVPVVEPALTLEEVGAVKRDVVPLKEGQVVRRTTFYPARSKEKTNEAD